MNEQIRKNNVYAVIKRHDSLGFNELYQLFKIEDKYGMSKPTFRKVIHDLNADGLISILKTDKKQKVRITADITVQQTELVWKQYVQKILDRMEKQTEMLDKKVKYLSWVDEISLIAKLLKMIQLLEYSLTFNSEIKVWPIQHHKRLKNLKEKVSKLAIDSESKYDLLSSVGRLLISDVVKISSDFDELISGKRIDDLPNELRIILTQLP